MQLLPWQELLFLPKWPLMPRKPPRPPSQLLPWQELPLQEATTLEPMQLLPEAITSLPLQELPCLPRRPRKPLPPLQLLPWQELPVQDAATIAPVQLLPSQPLFLWKAGASPPLETAIIINIVYIENPPDPWLGSLLKKTKLGPPLAM